MTDVSAAATDTAPADKPRLIPTPKAYLTPDEVTAILEGPGSTAEKVEKIAGMAIVQAGLDLEQSPTVSLKAVFAVWAGQMKAVVLGVDWAGTGLWAVAVSALALHVPAVAALLKSMF